MKTCLFLLCCCCLWLVSCHGSRKQVVPEKDFSAIKRGMSFIDVLNIAGAPDTIMRLGTVLDTFYNQTKTDEWHYGSNRIITIVNDTVFSIDLNATQTKERIQHIIDSARASDGNNTQFIQPGQ